MCFSFDSDDEVCQVVKDSCVLSRPEGSLGLIISGPSSTPKTL